MIEQITQPIWVSLKLETRNKLREIFKVPRSSASETITDNFGVSHIVSDGSTNVDLQAITVEKLVEYVGSAAINETIYDLFKRAVAKAETPAIVIETVDVHKGDFLKMPEIKDATPTINVPEGKTPLFKCPECAYTHASKRGMRMHQMRKHPVK